jgi:hypothetical protein
MAGVLHRIANLIAPGIWDRAMEDFNATTTVLVERDQLQPALQAEVQSREPDILALGLVPLCNTRRPTSEAATWHHPDGHAVLSVCLVHAPRRSWMLRLLAGLPREPDEVLVGEVSSVLDDGRVVVTIAGESAVFPPFMRVGSVPWNTSVGEWWRAHQHCLGEEGGQVVPVLTADALLRREQDLRARITAWTVQEGGLEAAVDREAKRLAGEGEEGAGS